MGLDDLEPEHNNTRPRGKGLAAEALGHAGREALRGHLAVCSKISGLVSE